ncbi:MAG: hypothetical protein KUG77_26195 [Nannocystaceae bacterium]|nr:hypothetical protein [Nannocystaceae bacterium]
MTTSSSDNTGSSPTADGTIGDPDMGVADGDPSPINHDHIWIANSDSGTVSKIDTEHGEERGRYRTGPREQAEPSRTSVNLLGDIAISNRGSVDGGGGGVTKIAAREEDCQDRNGSGTIETSAGPNDVLPWGDDECVLWNRAIPSDIFQHGPRPTAWEGPLEEDGTPTSTPRLWVAWYAFAENLARIHRLDGQTGEILDTVDVPWNGFDFGPYGGAVNADGDFWVLGWRAGPLIRIDGDTLEVERIELPTRLKDEALSYGMALDRLGNPWLTSRGLAMKWDLGTNQWQTVSTSNNLMRGIAIDREDRVWVAVDSAAPNNGCGLALIDAVSGDVVDDVLTIPGCATPVGVSVDFEGFIWVVDETIDAAFKINPDTLSTELMVDGLDQPYTYSDMTGFALNLVVNPSR